VAVLISSHSLCGTYTTLNMSCPSLIECGGFCDNDIVTYSRVN